MKGIEENVDFQKLMPAISQKLKGEFLHFTFSIINKSLVLYVDSNCVPPESPCYQLNLAINKTKDNRFKIDSFIKVHDHVNCIVHDTQDSFEKIKLDWKESKNKSKKGIQKRLIRIAKKVLDFTVALNDATYKNYWSSCSLKRKVIENTIGANLSGVDFSGFYLENVDFTGANLVGANFTGAHLFGANFTGANLVGANFTGAILKDNTIFTRANLSGVNFTSVDLQEANLSELEMNHAIFKNANLNRSYLRNVNLADTIINNTTFIDADIRESSIVDSVLTNVNFTGSDFTGSDFTRSKFENVNFTRSKFEDTIFEETTYKNVN